MKHSIRAIYQNYKSLTLLVVSAYARRAAAAAIDSLEPAFFRFSSSSRMSLIDFLVAGFWVFVQTAVGGADEAGVGGEFVTAAEVEADADGTMTPATSLADVFALTCEVGRPQDAVNSWESSEGEAATVAVARTRSRSAAFRASCFLVSISWISLRLIDAPALLFFLSSSVDQTGFVGTETEEVDVVGSFMG
jgi:hypothetical protein